MHGQRIHALSTWKRYGGRGILYLQLILPIKLLISLNRLNFYLQHIKSCPCTKQSIKLILSLQANYLTLHNSKMPTKKGAQNATEESYFHTFTASKSSLTGSCSWAQGLLKCWRDSLRELTTSPCNQFNIH